MTYLQSQKKKKENLNSFAILTIESNLLVLIFQSNKKKMVAYQKDI